jgi:putative transcriptional regulator
MDSFETKLAAAIGGNVRTLRTKRGWSQAVLAEHLDASVEFISLIERGERLPSLPTATRLARLLGTTTSQLLGEERLLLAERDLLQSLAADVPDAARTAVAGMLRGVIGEFRKNKKMKR